MLTLFDEYRCRTLLYQMRTKDEVFVKIKNFIMFIEQQKNKNVRAIKYDNELECCSQAMQQMLTNLGITHKWSNYSPPPPTEWSS